jgi:hypothetical protein
MGDGRSAISEELKKSLSGIVDQVVVTDHTVILKSLNIIESIPAITAAVRNLGLATGEMKLRENTLEDVFIHLTGRRLRS